MKKNEVDEREPTLGRYNSKMASVAKEAVLMPLFRSQVSERQDASAQVVKMDSGDMEEENVEIS